MKTPRTTPLARHENWLRQAKHDIDAAQAVKGASPSWACFCAQQAAEKAVKAIYYALGVRPPTRGGHWLHDLNELFSDWEDLVQRAAATTPALAAAPHLGLREHEQGSRYPDVKNPDAPCDLYEASDADKAISDSHNLITFCESIVVKASAFRAGL